ncbi:translation initiation factor IF-2 [Rhodamnia argentea]|uniref:Translation initiation factor IF-2 n=1 Tax=Rhodamnia argentea TaxID=178133 RepID=A0A8B8PM54_9MYRT|nr:translation initiation factor IF-2 [Rhodamnia argentea]
MRGAIGRRLPNSFTPSSSRHSLLPFSTSSPFGGGGGRGRGRGSGADGGPSRFDSTPGTPASGEAPEAAEPPSPQPQHHPPSSGLGRGRGKPLPSSPILPSFNAVVSSIGRGRASSASPPPPPDSAVPGKPIFFRKEDGPPQWDPPKPRSPSEFAGAAGGGRGASDLPSSIRSVLQGAGRGKPVPKPGPQSPPVQEENRHVRARPPSPPPPRMGREEAERRASGRGDRGGRSGGRAGRGRGRGFRAGRGRGSFGGRGFLGDRAERGQFQRDSDEGHGAGLYLGDNADGENLAKRIGAENMNKLVEAFEEMSERVLPSPAHDIYLDALHTNLLIECEPEYLMHEFSTNPDIDEKPPIPLRDALEKMKPFLMLYEGIQSQEEWEEVMKELMERVPLIKEIVDYYSGPDRVTAKQQQEELERVAKTLPQSAPSSVKRFTDRAVRSLQSNPGWGFDKKCQFMDKLVGEVSQQYK